MSKEKKRVSKQTATKEGRTLSKFRWQGKAKHASLGTKKAKKTMKEYRNNKKFTKEEQQIINLTKKRNKLHTQEKKIDNYRKLHGGTKETFNKLQKVKDKKMKVGMKLLPLMKKRSKIENEQLFKKAHISFNR